MKLDDVSASLKREGVPSARPEAASSAHDPSRGHASRASVIGTLLVLLELCLELGVSLAYLFAYMRGLEVLLILAAFHLACCLLRGAIHLLHQWDQRRERGEETLDLDDANFGGADLEGANLRDADLGGADLGGADLRGADLSRAELADAACGGTSFGDVDLSAVKGLESIRHIGPSTVGLDALVRSRGRIPAAFLRDCGVPETLIASLPSLIGGMEPIEFYSCFVSHDNADRDFVGRLRSRMRDRGLQVWVSPDDMQGGKEIDEQIDEAIRDYDKVLVVLSAESLRSDWVMTEIRKALKAKEGRRKLFPIRLVDMEAIRAWECIDTDSGKDLAVEIRKFFIPDFTNWKDHDVFEASFARLIKALEATEGPGRDSPPKRS